MKGKRVGVAGLLVVGVASALGCFWPFGKREEGLRLPGLVEIQEVRLGSKVGGRVAEVLTTEGDLVKAGQVLVRLEVPELEAQREQFQARLREAESQQEKANNGARPEELEAAEAAVGAAKARWKRLKAGFREEEIRQARNEVEAAEADRRLAQEEFDREQRLLRQGAAEQARYDLARANLERTRGRSAATRARLEMLQAGTRVEEVEEAAADLKRVEANLRLLQAGTRYEERAEADARVAEVRAKLREVEANLREAAVVAPEPAVVEVLAVRKGDIVGPNQPMLRVLRAADLWVKVYVPETDLGKVQLNQEVEVTVDSHADRRFRGQVLQINSESEFTPRNVQSVDERKHQVFGVRIRVEDPQGVFKSGMAAEVFLPQN